VSPRRKVSLVVTLVVLALLAIPVGWIAIRLVHPTSTATLEMNLVQSPPDDAALGAWLSTQPGLTKTSVRRGSGAVEGNPSLPNAPTLIVIYTMPGYQAGDFASNIVASCRQLGYQVNGYSVVSNGNPFRDLGLPFKP